MSIEERSLHRFGLGDQRVELGGRTLIMGILNVTPDSFSAGGDHAELDQAVDHALRMAEEGADWIDVGGESTRPGSVGVDAEEEKRRVLPVIARLRECCPKPVSIDTSKSEVAEEALQAGAVMVNDVTGLTGDARMLDVVRDHGASLCIMHMLGKPRTMQKDPQYDDVLTEVKAFLHAQADVALEGGIPEDRILLDPGIGFGKTLEHNLILMSRSGEVGGGRYPVLVGPSRKSFIGSLLDLPAEQRVEGTLGAIVASIARGAHVVRVHDVSAAYRTLRVADAILQASFQLDGWGP